MVEAKIRENNYLEYKGSDFLNIEKNKEQYQEHRGNLIEKIAEFANIRGGIIILGIKEDPKTKEAIEIQTPDIPIPKFEQVLSRVIMNGLQPAIIVDWVCVKNPKNQDEYVYVIKVDESEVPVMVYLSGYKEGIFPIRIGDDTKIAGLNEVELLFQKKGKNLQKQNATIDIFETIFKMFDKTEIEINLQVKKRMFRRIIIQFKPILSDLGFILDEENGVQVLFVLDNFSFSCTHVVDLRGIEEGNCFITMLKQLKEFWLKKGLIQLKKDDFSTRELIQQFF